MASFNPAGQDDHPSPAPAAYISPTTEQPKVDGSVTAAFHSGSTLSKDVVTAPSQAVLARVSGGASPELYAASSLQHPGGESMPHSVDGTPLPPTTAPVRAVAGRGTTFGNQTNALLRKSGVYQRRQWCSNVCLLSAPIFFCLILFALQWSVNNLLLSGEDYEVSGRLGRAGGG